MGNSHRSQCSFKLCSYTLYSLFTYDYYGYIRNLDAVMYIIFSSINFVKAVAITHWRFVAKFDVANYLLWLVNIGSHDDLRPHRVNRINYNDSRHPFSFQISDHYFHWPVMSVPLSCFVQIAGMKNAGCRFWCTLYIETAIMSFVESFLHAKRLIYLLKTQHRCLQPSVM